MGATTRVGAVGVARGVDRSRATRARVERVTMTTTSTRATKSWRDEMRDDDGEDADAGSDAFVRASDVETERAFAYEPKSKSKRRRDRSTTRRARVDVDSAAVDAARGTGTKTMSQESEEAFVKFLLGYIVVIFVFGVVLGVSAFGALPEAADAFVAGTLYPNFTPFVGGFLAFSSVYGLIKTRDDPRSK